MFIKHLTSKRDNILSCFCINMNLCCKIALLLLFVFYSAEQDCPDIDKRVSHNAIPFILPITTETEKCHGIIVSRNYILTNAKCVNGSVAVIVEMNSRKNAPYENIDNIILLPENIIIHEHFRKIHSTYYQNDWALLKLPSPLNFSVVLKPASFLLNDENIDSATDNTAEIVVWKAGHLISTAGVIQKRESCVRDFGYDFNPNYHLCALISDDISITYVDDSISHPVLVNGEIAGFAIPYAVLNKSGKVYRIMRLSVVMNWIQNYTNINQDGELVNDLYQDVEDCLFHNIDSLSFSSNFLTLNSILNQLIQGHVNHVKRETNTAVDPAQLEVKENIQSLDELKLLVSKAFISDKKSSSDIDVLAAIKSHVDNITKEIYEEIDRTYIKIQGGIFKTEQDILNKISIKYIEIEDLLQDKGRDLDDIRARLSIMERKID